jgi:uncharacterized membrane protein YdjX (TVP38/TMEM64 family)
MTIDFTRELAPVLWTMVGLLLVAGGALVASIDPELAEVYLGDRRFLVATVALAVLTIVALVAVQPGTAARLGLPLR